MRAIERSLKQLKDGKVVIKTMEELEQMAAEQGIDMKTASLEELDELWAVAKKL